MAVTTRPRTGTFVRQAAWYVIAGTATTAVQAVLFVVLRTTIAAHVANLIAIAVTTLANTEFHRRFTFAGARYHAARRYLQTVLAIAFYAGSGSLALLALHLAVDDAGATLETITLVATSTAGGIARFLALRYWVFRS